MAEMKRRKSEIRPRLDLADSVRGAAPEAKPVPSPVSSDEVARRAYELYEHRGGEQGHDWDDWFQAEREVRQGASRAR